MIERRKNGTSDPATNVGLSKSTIKYMLQNWTRQPMYDLADQQ
jgi:hypothetical protein